MDNKSIFNATVCIIGIAILLIHALNLFLKKERRKDENNLLIFILLTAIHLGTYLIFTFIKENNQNNYFIMAFYTTFYIMNNIEILLLFAYTISYISAKKKIVDIFTLINISIFVIFIILDITNLFTHLFFYADNGVYIRSKTMFISQGYQFVSFVMVIILTFFNRRLSLHEKLAFIVYCLLPLVAIVIQNLLPGYAIAYLAIILAIEVLFLFLNYKRNIELANESRRNKEAEVRLMMSQIKPHFIYNTLSSISTLITIDPEKAQNGLDSFTEYLRSNLSSLSNIGLIKFKDELKHVETYLALEKMRFDDRLTIIYNIKVDDFLVPPLSIQPLVENAVKHGILKKIEGGTVIISTYEDDNAYYVNVDDDGVGFNVDELKEDDNKHIGLNNVKYRLHTMCRGEMFIISDENQGTNITVKFYK